MLRRTRALTVVGIAATAVTVASILPIFAGDDDGLLMRPVADSTVTQVPQDGDTSVKTTLASCPKLCDGNPNGRRDAVLEFAVGKLPADAVDVQATLRVYAWHDFSARVVARTVRGSMGMIATPGQDRDGGGQVVQAIETVAKGYNDFDVSGGVQGNGTFTFALQQETHNTRVYWASRENSKPDLHPQLVLTYRTQARPAPTTAKPTTPEATPSRPSTTLPPPTTVPTTAPPSSTAPTTRPPTLAPTTTRPPAIPPPPSAPQGWREVWSDNFDSGTIDNSKWNLRNGEGRDIDLGCNMSSPKNTFTNDGMLTLRALRGPTQCSSQNRAYSQSYLDTIGKASWTYGRFEMRAKSPNGPANSTGLWPAFWLRPDDGGNGEIDVVELPGGSDWYAKATQAIFWDYSPVKQDVRTWPASVGGYPGDGFHTYTTEWEPGSLRWFIDGKLVWERNRSTTPWFDKAFSKPYNIRLNFQVGGWLGNPDANTKFPADFVVDYVKVWQR